MPEVPKLGRIDHGGGRGYNYARWEDINDHIKPVLQKYGFGLRFDIITETESLFEIEAILVHRSGYSICTRKKLPIDKSGAKNIVQAYGSTQSYAQRYAAIALLNLTFTATRIHDGNAASRIGNETTTQIDQPRAQLTNDRCSTQRRTHRDGFARCRGSDCRLATCRPAASKAPSRPSRLSTPSASERRPKWSSAVLNGTRPASAK